MHIAEIALFTAEPDRLVAFYERVLQRPPETRWPGGAIFSVGEAKLLIHVADEQPRKEGGPLGADHFALAVADVDEAAARL